MSGLELIGSVLMFGFSGPALSDPRTRRDIDELKAIGVKGVVLFDQDIAGGGRRNIVGPAQLVRLIEDLRHELGSELIVAIDQEGGAVARLGETDGFLPALGAAELGALPEADQTREAIRQAQQLARLGIDLNFAPCVDLAVEPDSPVIAARGRSFGDDPERVSRSAQIVIDEHLRARVACCLKHFPGHGSALLDSHLGLCDITGTHTRAERDVFEELIGLYGERVAVMTGHLIDARIDPDRPASLSRPHTGGVLRDRLGFGGVVVTDSLDMRAIRDHLGETHAALCAINAGADIVLDGLNAPGYREPGAPTRIAQGLVRALRAGEIEGGEARLEASGDRIRSLMSPRRRAASGADHDP